MMAAESAMTRPDLRQPVKVASRDRGRGRRLRLGGLGRRGRRRRERRRVVVVVPVVFVFVASVVERGVSARPTGFPTS